MTRDVRPAVCAGRFYTRDAATLRRDIEGYLQKYMDKELLRFVAIGSVDDGKSTLIGRLLLVMCTGIIPSESRHGNLNRGMSPPTPTHQKMPQTQPKK